QLALENLMQDRTSIVIAHRLSTILTANLIVVVENGRIVDQGKHAKLLERCDIYRTLYEMQFGAAS
ncbi:MAG: ABC transporter ATP-binding protein, partial [Humidesulfovibrio sp.]|nr:ABC transporter ATP-binding protein [Humidesulfovibrio sp.]